VLASEQVPAARALELKEAIDWFDRGPFVRPAGLGLIGEVASLSAAPPGVVLASLMPTGFRVALLHEVMPLAQVPGIDLVVDRWYEADLLEPDTLELLRRQGLVLERARRRPQLRRVLAAERPPDGALAGRPQANQLRALEALMAGEHVASAAELAREAEVPDSAVRALIAKGYAAYREIEAPAPALPLPPPALPALRPAALELPRTSSLALSGGSRRERLAVVLPLLREDLRSGASVLVLVPEAHLVAETAALLGDHVPVVMLTSEAGDDVREVLWATVRDGPPVVLVGTFLTLLAPLERIGRVVVIEAGSSSYKMRSGARLFVPAAALRLARLAGSPVVVADGVASPEMLLAAEAHVSLPYPRQRLHVADMAATANWPLHTDLIRVLRQVAQRERQALVVSPRRGYSAALGCPDCGWVADCPNCDLTLRYHEGERSLRCHQCGFEQRPPERCPACDHTRVGPQRGPGTEWLAKAVAVLLPDFPLYRYDRDRRDDLSPLHAGAPGVVVGTSALLRVAPLPVLSLVAVGLLDTHLNVADFRAEEETLRMLVGLSELSTTAVPLLLVQTFQPDHPLLRALSAGGIDRFVAELGARRRRFGYPPFSHLARVQITARDAAQARAAAERLASRLRTAGAAESELIGPAAAPVARLRGQFAYQLFVRAGAPERLTELVAAVDQRLAGARVRIDVDPRDVAGYLT
jgi:primosomal protein N' (replication factor Y)